MAANEIATNKPADYTVDDMNLARKILVRLGQSPDAYPHRVEWIAEEICMHRERSHA